MKKGRPCRSEIRQNVVEILYFLGKGYGYQISKIYNEIFSKVSQRSIYYHLRKGISIGELELNKIEQEEGNFSWGKVVEKIYYSLGKKAMPKGELKVKEFLEKVKL
jgi:DNA-binding transcriptional ArsR family regulator